MTWQAECWLDDLSGEYGDWRWLCACGASGSERTWFDASHAFRAHLAESAQTEVNAA